MNRLTPAFLLSLPRSGSTLLQRMLGAHPAISTTAEPWILLPLLSALDTRGVYARYDHRVAQRAIVAFLDQLPDGDADYLQQVREFAEGLYAGVADPGARIFLDKTPRYGLYADRLLAAFPASPMVVIWRNPLAIVASLLRSWLHDRWMPYLHIVDLYDVLDGLTSAVAANPGRFLQVRYEDLVRDPEAMLRSIIHGLGLEWDPRVVSHFARTDVRGPVGDRSGSLTGHAAVSPAAADRWPEAFASPLRKRWARRYLTWIGRDRLRLMGYADELLRADLDAVPTRWATVPADAAFTVRGLAWRTLEPRIARDKWKNRSAPARILSHG